MRTSYLAYAMSVIASRALPDVRDGLKPVQRRILYAMREMGMTPDKQHRKCAGVIGEVLKSYHPHGDSSVYDALVRMAQDFSLRYPLVDGHGNFGSIDPNPPAAYRYTEARLGRPSMDLLADIDKETVDFIPNFDGQTEEPVVLPGRLPQLLDQRLERYRGRHGDEHSAAQRQRNLRCDRQAHRRFRRRRRSALRHRQGSGFPDRRRAAGTRGDPASLQDRTRFGRRARHAPRSSKRRASIASRSASCPIRSRSNA